MRETHQAYNKLLHDKGKAPTAKQTARLAEEVVNQWFAGDIHAFYGVIGEKSPIQPVQRRRLPLDRERFIREVFSRLGGRSIGTRPAYDDQARYNLYNKQVQEQWAIARLTEHSLKYIQLWEILDRPPIMEEAAGRTFEQWCGPIGDTPETAWQHFSSAIVAAVGAAETIAEVSVKQRQAVPPVLDIHPQPDVSSAHVEQGEHQEPIQDTVNRQTETQASLEGVRQELSPSSQPQPRKRSWLDRLLGRK